MPSVHITAPSRLHFGLWSLGDGPGRRFGGVGAMIDSPQFKLSIADDQELSASGPAADRALIFARRWAEFHQRSAPPCHIEIERSIPAHAGLGSGTQLALAIAAGLSAFCGLTSQSPQELALSVGRGLRSAVGTYGFAYGGLIVEQGKLSDEPISPLDCRLDLPPAWRFVLARPQELSGLAAEDEIDAFSRLPPFPQTKTDQLITLVRDELVPAAATADFDQFAKTLYEYGCLSGECFAARQGGPFNGPLLTSLIEHIRQLGYAGVGQSSWGPAIFTVVPSQDAAEKLVHSLQPLRDLHNLDLVIAAPNNRGARIEARGIAELATHG